MEHSAMTTGLFYRRVILWRKTKLAVFSMHPLRFFTFLAVKSGFKRKERKGQHP